VSGKVLTLRVVEAELRGRIEELEGLVSRLAADVAATRTTAETALLLGGGGSGGAGGSGGPGGAGGGGGGAAGSFGGSGGIVQGGSVVVSVRRIYGTSAGIALVVGVLAGVIANHLS